MKQIRKSWLIVLLLLSIVSCSRNKIDELVNIDNSNINSQLNCRLAPNGNEYRTIKPVFIELKRVTNDEVVLPYDYGSRIFEKTKNGWVELEQSPIDRGSTDEIVLSNQLYLAPVQIVMVLPVFKDNSITHSLRIYLIGNMKQDGNEIEVACATTIHVSP